MALIIPTWLPAFGDPKQTQKGKEDDGLESFFNHLRKHRPQYSNAATHVQNERKRTYAQAQADKLKGMVTGWPDITLIGVPPFICEMKVQGGVWQANQLTVLEAHYQRGAFVCLGWGSRGAWDALLYWEQNILVNPIALHRNPN